MFTTTYTFHYNPENLHAFAYLLSRDGLTIPFIFLGIVLIYGSLYILAPHIYSFILTRAKNREKEEKHAIIKNLILMKEIQGELEKEIEQSLLNITLQGKGV